MEPILECAMVKELTGFKLNESTGTRVYMALWANGRQDNDNQAHYESAPIWEKLKSWP